VLALSRRVSGEDAAPSDWGLSASAEPCKSATPNIIDLKTDRALELMDGLPVEKGGSNPIGFLESEKG
jgi:hypothetical protein